jgi:hypothetical protein
MSCYSMLFSLSWTGRWVSCARLRQDNCGIKLGPSRMGFSVELVTRSCKDRYTQISGKKSESNSWKARRMRADPRRRSVKVCVTARGTASASLSAEMGWRHIQRSPLSYIPHNSEMCWPRVVLGRSKVHTAPQPGDPTSLTRSHRYVSQFRLV